MSHWTTVSTDITDVERLEEALDALGIKHRKEGDRIILDDFCYFEKKNGKYQVVADWYYESRMKVKKTDIAKITNMYTYKKAVSEARKRGFTVSEEQIQKDGSIKFKLRKFN
jgi:hypothetical protein